MTDIAVACVGADGAWVCSVRVQDEHSATDHVVSVDEIDLPPALDGAELVDIERLLVATFEFLLEREPKESILRPLRPGRGRALLPGLPGRDRPARHGGLIRVDQPVSVRRSTR